MNLKYYKLISNCSLNNKSNYIIVKINDTYTVLVNLDFVVYQKYYLLYDLKDNQVTNLTIIDDFVKLTNKKYDDLKEIKSLKQAKKQVNFKIKDIKEKWI